MCHLDALTHVNLLRQRTRCGDDKSISHLEVTDQLEDLGGDGRIIFKRIFKNR
jgi:hypothetical protein